GVSPPVRAARRKPAGASGRCERRGVSPPVLNLRRVYRRAYAAPLAAPTESTMTWLLTWTTYGTWLPGDVRGFVSGVRTETGETQTHTQPGTPVVADIPSPP